MYVPSSLCVYVSWRSILLQTSNSSKTRGAAAPCTRITWTSFVVGSKEPSLKLNYNINSLLQLRVGMHIICDRTGEKVGSRVWKQNLSYRSCRSIYAKCTFWDHFEVEEVETE